MTDEDWRNKTDERILNIVNTDSTQNDRLDEIDDELTTIREILEGKSTDRDDNGLKGELVALNRTVNELRALMMPDHLGHGGIINRLKALERNAGLEEKKNDNFWKFWTAVSVALLSLVGLLISNWDKVHKFLYAKSTDPIDQIINKAKHPKGRHYRRTVVVPANPPDSDAE